MTSKGLKLPGTGIRVIPPAIFMVAMVGAYLMDWVWPFRIIPDAVQYALGIVVILLSFGAMPWTLAAFKRAKTTFDVRRQATALITGGPFRFSRNPTYVAMIALCAGIGIVADNGWVLPALGAAIAYLHFAVIVAEERHLEYAFGDKYRAYKRRVRRWL